MNANMKNRFPIREAVKSNKRLNFGILPKRGGVNDLWNPSETLIVIGGKSPFEVSEILIEIKNQNKASKLRRGGSAISARFRNLTVFCFDGFPKRYRVNNTKQKLSSVLITIDCSLTFIYLILNEIILDK